MENGNSTNPFEGVGWVEGLRLGLRGQGWKDEERESPYDRVPLEARERVSANLWYLMTNAAGLHGDFRTAAKDIYVRWELDSPSGGYLDHYSARCARSGVDCYGYDEERGWCWVGAQEAWQDPDCMGQVNRLTLDGKERLYRIYLPLRRRVRHLEVGVRGEMQPVVPDANRPIAYYGTSIVHGAGVSRPGLAHASILGRKLGREVLNLGVCGSALCEPVVAECLGRLEPELYIIDVLPNNTAEALPERLEKFLHILRRARPETPVLLLGDRVFGDAAFAPEREQDFLRKNEALRTTVNKLQAAGMTGLELYFDESWYGSDFEGTSDASHPNDLGAMRMAEKLDSLLRRFLP